MTMIDHFQFCQIFLVLMLPVVVTQVTVVQNNFRKLEPGQNITGTIGAELKTGSHQECSLRQVLKILLTFVFLHLVFCFTRIIS